MSSFLRLKLIKKKAEAPNTNSFLFQPEQPLNWKAGQFLRYRIEDPNPDNRRVDRFFTIASAPHEGHVMLTTKFVPGDGSTFKKDLQNMKIGDYIEATPPSGSFTIEDPNKEYVFLAGGIGITPFRSILMDLDHKGAPINVTLLYANKIPEVTFKTELEELSKKHPLFKIIYIIDPQKIDEEFINKKIPDYMQKTFYVSGPEPMVEAMEQMLYKMGLKEERVVRDYFPGYTWP